MTTKAFTFILAALILNGCKKNYITEEDVSSLSVKRAKIETLSKTKEPIPVYASGVLASKAESNLSFKTGGVIAKILVDEGDYFKAGQLLARLNLAEIESQVIQARNTYEKALRDLKRVNNLYNENAATLEQVQDLTTAVEVAEANLRIANFNLRYSKIIAPEDGKVLSRFSEEGEVISSGNPVLRVGSTGSDHFIMRIGVSDKDVIRLALNDSAIISFDPYPGVRFKAYISEIHESADMSTGTFEVELTLLPTEYLLKNGFIGKLRIFPSKQHAYYRIPIKALIDGNENGASVYLYESEARKAKKVFLSPFYIDDDHFYVIEEALPESAAILTEGSAYLADGEVIQPF
jgi:RND family efflux transporter MFP subunit